MTKSNKKVEPWQPRVPTELLQFLGPFDEPALPNVEVGRFESPYLSANESPHDAVLTMLALELIAGLERYSGEVLPVAGNGETTTGDLIQLVESRISLDSAGLYSMMNHLSFLGLFAAGLENLNFGLPYRSYERHFVLAVDLVADEISASTGYVALGRYGASANYYLARAAIGYSKEVALNVDREILLRARESLDELIHRLPPEGRITIPT